MAAFKQMTATGQITSPGSPAKLCGYEVVVVLGAGAVTISQEDGSGAAIMVIPANTVAGSRVNLPQPIDVPKGLYATFVSTGTVNFLFE